VKELRTYRQIAEMLRLNLFVVRNSDGSGKEYDVLEDVFARISLTGELVLSAFEPKIAMENLDVIICGIKDLQMRKYVKIDLII
jgi:hypothetical protein